MKMKLVALAMSLIVSGAAHAGLVIESDQAPRSDSPRATAAAGTRWWSSSTDSAPASAPQTGAQTAVAQTAVAQTALVNGARGQAGAYSATPSANLPAISESGARPKLAPLTGWANDVPLGLALRQIVPLDFELRTNGIPTSDHVSWSGSTSWVESLRALTRSGLFVAHINWVRKEVSLAPGAWAAPAIAQRPAPSERVTHTPTAPQDTYRLSPSAPSAQVDIKGGDMSTHDAGRPQALVSPTAPVATVHYDVGPTATNMWRLNPKMTLRENVEEWTRLAGWNRVVWEGADYPIMAPAEFQGAFTSETGPLAQLIMAYESSDQPLIARLSTLDKVVYIRNKFHERNQVVPASPQEIAPQMFKMDGASTPSDLGSANPSQ